MDRDGVGNAEPPDVRSKTSSRHSYIRFMNTTQRRVDVIWINYDGVRVKYKTLEPREYFDVTSFVNHPWVFRDSETGTKLVCGSREVFDCPEPKYIKIKDGEIKPTRVVVSITIPLYSLRECSMQAIQRLLKSPEDVKDLEIPFPLRQELQQLLCKSSTRR